MNIDPTACFTMVLCQLCHSLGAEFGIDSIIEIIKSTTSRRGEVETGKLRT